MEEAKEIVENAVERGDTTLELSSLELEELAPEILSEALCFVTVLNLDYNDLSCLPSEISLLSSLEVLSASGNHLRDLPQTLQELKKLGSLHLNENCLRELPVLLSKIPTLKILNLMGNGIETWTSELGESMEELRLDENNLKTLPRSFCHMKNLKILELGDNDVAGLPEDVGSLNRLEILNLSQNEISKLPSSFGNLPRVKSLDLSGNDIEDLPDSFQSAEIIENLFIEKNSLKSLPPWFESLHSIVNLGLSDNQLLGSPLPDCFGTVSGKSLKTLDLSANSISQLPSTIGELQSLEKLKLGSTIDELERRAFQNGNWLCILPSNFGWMICLKKLHLDENQLVKLPENFGLLQNLEWLDLGQNHIQNLPQSFCSLSKLWFLQLSQNYLKVLPDNFGDLTSLVELRLNNNYLTELPSSFANLANLQTLDLFHNELSMIPKELVSLKKLLRLDLDKNKFKLRASKVPKLTKQVKYPMKDPNLKDNWRGKVREDYIEPEEVKTVGILKEMSGDSEEDEPDDETLYSEEALKFAMKRSLSIWKSHEGSDQREVYKQRDEGEVVPNLSVLHKQSEETVIDSSKSLYNEIFEDAEDCIPVQDPGLSWSLPDEGIETLSNGASQSEDTVEDWDKEIQSAQAYDLMLDMFKQRRQYKICLQNQLHNLLCSYPPASQAFTKTANYESAVYSLPLYSGDAQLSVSLDSGQFDDADEDQQS